MVSGELIRKQTLTPTNSLVNLLIYWPIVVVQFSLAKVFVFLEV